MYALLLFARRSQLYLHNSAAHARARELRAGVAGAERVALASIPGAQAHDEGEARPRH